MARLSFLSAALLALAACQSVPPETPPLPPIAGPERLVAPAAGADGGGDPVPGATRDAAPAAAATAPAAQAAAAAAPAAAISTVGPPDPGAVSLAGRPFFCARLQPLPTPPPYCTRSIGQVDCWMRPPLAVPPRPGLADGRMTLTPSQAAQRTQCWPGLF